MRLLSAGSVRRWRCQQWSCQPQMLTLRCAAIINFLTGLACHCGVPAARTSAAAEVSQHARWPCQAVKLCPLSMLRCHSLMMHMKSTS